MGVFARLFRKSDTPQGAPAAATQAEAPAGEDGPAEDRTADQHAAEVTLPDASDSGKVVRPAAGGAGVTEPEGVGIPKQQSAGEAVDNEADKGART